MSGTAKTSKFMLSTATLMLGELGQVQTLNESNSIGLVKNVTLKSVPKFTNLTQGVRNSIVMSKQTENQLTVSGEMYEYTGANIGYALGFNGYELTLDMATATTLANDITTDTVTVEVTDTADFEIGQWVAIHANPRGQIFIRKIAGIAPNTSLTFTVAYPGVSYPTLQGGVVEVVDIMPTSEWSERNPYLSCKITGQLADDSWVTILIGKVKATSGLSMAFKTDNFDSIPLVLESHILLPGDSDFDFFTNPVTGSLEQALIFTPGLPPPVVVVPVRVLGWSLLPVYMDPTGWALSGDGQKLMVTGYETYIDFSVDRGATWTTAYSGPLGYWSGCASSNDGSVLMAVDGSSFCYVSSDSGVTWTQRATPAQFVKCFMSGDGTNLIGAPSFGHLWRSADNGATWTQAATEEYWRGCALSADGTKLVAVAHFNSFRWTSTNSGASWTIRAGVSYDEFGNWTGCASSSDGVHLIACASEGLVWLSHNSGVSWSTVLFNSGWNSCGSSDDGTRLIVASYDSDGVWVSLDSGVTWEQELVGSTIVGSKVSGDGSLMLGIKQGGGGPKVWRGEY